MLLNSARSPLLRAGCPLARVVDTPMRELMSSPLDDMPWLSDPSSLRLNIVLVSGKNTSGA